MRRAAGVAMLLLLAGCADRPARDPIQTVRDGLFYDGLAAYHEGYYKEAAMRWERASRFGDSDAARNLGHLYRQGLGVEEDAAIAASWYLVAAEDGNPGAQYNLGMLYLKGGTHLEPDRAKGMPWLEKAAAGGLLPARLELERQKEGGTASPQPQPQPQPQQEPEPIFAPSPPAPAPAVVPDSPKIRVQIGSYRDRAAAEADWVRLRPPGLEPEYRDGHTGDGRRWTRLLAVGDAESVEAYCREAPRHRITCWPGRRR